MKGHLIGVLVLLAATSARAEVDDEVLKAESERVGVIARAQEATVAIFTNSGQGGGSGVVISPDGYALTNFHVVTGAGEGVKCGMSNGELYDAAVVGIDPVGDVALIQLFGRNDFPAAVLGDSDSVRAGDWVFVIGNPFLLATDFKPTVTYGIVSGVHRYQYPAGTLLEYADCIQTDASINPGNSGGPLFDSAGRLIGVNGRGSFEKRGRVNVGVGYAISINQIKNFMGCLRSGRIVDHATLGARVASQEDGRVVVTDILESSDAYRRGLRYGDELVEFGGRPVQTVNGFKNILGTFPKGWRVPLAFRRRGQRYDVPVRLAGVHGVQELIDKVTGKPSIEPPAPKPAPDPNPNPNPP
ncbi:MAG TPA: trypsin-like peptidase domain-containing protein, partial [Pirellulales bacterium]|nr:trypsin-like peptidase domain-containing protein [Pirellulales bacterium]